MNDYKKPCENPDDETLIFFESIHEMEALAEVKEYLNRMQYVFTEEIWGSTPPIFIVLRVTTFLDRLWLYELGQLVGGIKMKHTQIKQS
jgi:hypothetical protein